MEISNLTGLEKPLEKLIDVCAQGLGAIARPWLIKREAKALAEARVILTAGGLPEDLQDGSAPMLPEIVKRRVEYREAKRIENISGVFDQARRSLPEAVSPDSVDPDWVARFFEYAQDVSNSQMQELWGRLLAGEVARPQSFSLRAIEIVRNLAPAEAVAFGNLARLIFSEQIDFYLPPVISEFKGLGIPGVVSADKRALSPEIMSLPDFYESRGLGHRMLAQLAESGLAEFHDDLAGTSRRFSLLPGAGPSAMRLKLGHRVLVVEDVPGGVSVIFGAHKLTPAGSELLRICDGSPDVEFEGLVVAELVRLGFKAGVHDATTG